MINIYSVLVVLCLLACLQILILIFFELFLRYFYHALHVIVFSNQQNINNAKPLCYGWGSIFLGTKNFLKLSFPVHTKISLV